MTPTHESILTAIDAADEDADTFDGGDDRHQHCDDLRATAELHPP